jgi:tetraacyldisaccharide 4'-kinase
LRAQEPEWWYGSGPHWQPTLLSPIGVIVGCVATARLRYGKPYRSRLPVICVGNFTAGGSGKTPLALLLSSLVSDLGREPWYLSRGYGGRLNGPLRVEPAIHTANDVGDEPLLLARHAPTLISRDRRAGAKAIEDTGSQDAVIIMDDGLQNPSLAKDLSIAVVDPARGFGNGRVIPAGPLRAPLAAQIGLADLIVLTGRDQSGDTPLINALRKLTRAPIVRAETQAAEGAGALRGRRVIAYAGIANPQRFFSLLDDLGAIVVEQHAFADHHVFSDREARDLIATAERTGASLITTEKDLARLSAAPGIGAELREGSTALPIKMVIAGDNLTTLLQMVRRAIAR